MKWKTFGSSHNIQNVVYSERIWTKQIPPTAGYLTLIVGDLNANLATDSWS